MMKGQIFTLDFLASVSVIVVVLAAITIQFEQAYRSADDSEYMKIKQLANDISQWGVKGFMNSSNNIPNNITGIPAFFNSFLTINIPAEYGIQLDLPSSNSLIRGGCPATKKYIAKVSRIAYQKPNMVLFNASVCK